MGYRTQLAALVASATLVLSACKSDTKAHQADPNAGKSGATDAAPMEITDRSPLVAGPGTIVTLTGKNFRSGLKLAALGLQGAAMPAVTVESDTKATFTMPAGAAFGPLALTLEQDGTSQRISVFFEAGQTDFPIITDSADQICTGKKFYNASGTLTEGTKNCSGTALANCKSDGEVGCATTAAYKAVKMANFTDGDIRTGVTVAGIDGALSGAPAACSSDGQLGCLSVTNFPAVDKVVKLTAGNIKDGVIIAGVTGDYPSATNVLAGADGTADLDLATFDAKVKAAAAFEWFDSTGARYTNTGDTDIIQAKIANGETIFGTTGNLVGGAAPAAWDLRAGVTVGAVTGKLKSNCRNGVNSAIIDHTFPGLAATLTNGNDELAMPAHGLSPNDEVRILYTTEPTGLNNFTTYYVIVLDAGRIQLSTTSGPGAAFDFTGDGADVTVHRWNDGTRNIWDTIDDHNSGGFSLSQYPAGWSADNFCGGVDTPAGGDEDLVWQDVTATASGAAGCDTAGDECRMKDKISGLEWSEYGGVMSLGWRGAVEYCENLTHDSQSDWRLPTQKELMDAYTHGIRSADNANWLTAAQMDAVYFWSASSVSNDPGSAWIVNLANGITFYANKDVTGYHAVCVR
jgi:hypothetical protein